jgi:hypothetical protein
MVFPDFLATLLLGVPKNNTSQDFVDLLYPATLHEVTTTH